LRREEKGKRRDRSVEEKGRDWCRKKIKRG
jgi:hypothetical protein